MSSSFYRNSVAVMGKIRASRHWNLVSTCSDFDSYHIASSNQESKTGRGTVKDQIQRNKLNDFIEEKSFQMEKATDCGIQSDHLLSPKTWRPNGCPKSIYIIMFIGWILHTLLLLLTDYLYLSSNHCLTDLWVCVLHDKQPHDSISPSSINVSGRSEIRAFRLLLDWQTAKRHGPAVISHTVN